MLSRGSNSHRQAVKTYKGVHLNDAVMQCAQGVSTEFYLRNGQKYFFPGLRAGGSPVPSNDCSNYIMDYTTDDHKAEADFSDSFSFEN